MRVELLHNVPLNESDKKTLADLGRNKLFPAMKMEETEESIIYFLHKYVSSKHALGRLILELNNNLVDKSSKAFAEELRK